MEKKEMIIVIVLFVCLGVLGIVISLEHKSHRKETERKKTQDENILISQYDLKKDYGWEDIVLWSESKESFEKAYNTKLNWMNYTMGFQKNPMCTDPIGGGVDWQYDKKCFDLVLSQNMPNMLDEIAVQTRGKTLVVIGSIHNNNQRFFGDVYWIGTK